MLSDDKNLKHSPIRVSAIEYTAPVGKRISLAPDGETLEKFSILKIRASTGDLKNLVFQTAAEAFNYRLTADPCTMFLTGTFNPEIENAKVAPQSTVSRLHQDKFGQIIAATKENLEFRTGPSLISIDVDVRTEEDDRALWPVKGFPALTTAQEVLNALYEVLPEAVGCPVLVMPSSSSLIEHADTGRILKGPGGWRVLLVTDDALQTPRILRTIHARCWAYGIYRYAFISRGGAFQDRSLADLALARPTQPDYPAPVLGRGLRKSDGCTLMENLSEPYFLPPVQGVKG